MAFIDPSLNIQILARLGKDAEMRSTNSGKAVTNVSGAHNHRYTQDGEKKEITTWAQFTFWGDAQAALAKRLLKKGCYVLFNGRPGVNSYTDANGDVQSSISVDVADFKIVAYPENYQMGAADGTEQAVAEDDNIPF